MRIINPTFGIKDEDKVVSNAVGPVNWYKDPIILFSNNKPNIKELFEGLKLKLATVRNVDEVDFIAKDSAGVPAPMPMIEEVAAKYKIALLGSAD